MGVAERRQRNASRRQRLYGGQSALVKPSEPMRPASQVRGGGRTGGPIDTSHITIGSEAEEMLARNQRAASNLVRASSDPQVIKRAEQIEQSGFSRALGGLGSILEVIDRARKTVTLGIMDVVGTDERRDKEISLGDYWDVITGDREGLIESLGTEVVGERGDVSTSQLLEDVWSSESADTWFEKAGRGVASFAGDVAFDPLTYLTFGASAVPKATAQLAVKRTIAEAGRAATKRAIAAATGRAGDDVARAALSTMDKGLEAAIRSQGDDIAERILRENVEKGIEMTRDEVIEKAYREAAGLERVVAEGAEDIGKEIDSFRKGIVGEKIEAVGSNVVDRNFATLRSAHPDYVEHVFTKGPAGQALGAAFTTGGARFALPFSLKSTKPIRGTAGAFEKLPGLRTLHRIPKTRVGQKFGELMPMVDATNPMVQAMRRGVMNGDEVAPDGTKILSYTELDWISQVMHRYGGKARNDTLLTNAFQEAETLHKALKGLDAEDAKFVWGQLFNGMQAGAVPPAVAARFGDDIIEPFRAAAEAFHNVLGDSYQVIQRFSPNTGRIDNYVPLVFSQDFHKLMKQMSEKGAPFSGDALEAAAKRLSAASGEEITAEDLALFMEAYESQIKRRAGGTDTVGEAAMLHRRTMGRYLQELDPAVESRIAMLDTVHLTDDGAEFGSKQFADQLEMNESLTKVAKAIAADKGYKVGDDFSAFVTDPIDLLQNYVVEVANVAQQRSLLQAAKQVGGVRATSTAVNQDHMAFLLGDTTAFARERVNRLIANRTEEARLVMQPSGKMKKINVGPNSTIEVPVEFADDPDILRVVEKLRSQNAKLVKKQKAFQQARRRQVEHWVRRGLDEANAEYAADLGNEALQQMRVEYFDAVEEAANSLYDDLTQAYFSLAYDQAGFEEAIGVAAQNREWLKAKAKREWEAVEAEYLRVMREKAPKKTKELPPRYFNLDDPVQYDAAVNSVLEPLGRDLEQTRQRMIEHLNRKADELLKERDEIAATLSTKKNKNAVDKKPEEGPRQKGKMAKITALGERRAAYLDIAVQLENAAALDDEVIALINMAASSYGAQEAAFTFHGAWDEIVREGIEIRRAKELAQGIDPRYQKSLEAERLWDEFTEAVEAGQGNIDAAMLDVPAFNTIIADGIYDWDWPYWKNMHAEGLGTDLPSGTHISLEEIETSLEAKIEKLSGVKLDKAMFDLDAEAQKTVRVMKAELESDLAMIREGDVDTIRRYIINNWAGNRQAYAEQGNILARGMTKGVKVGDSIVAAKRHFATIAQASRDPHMQSQLPEALEAINKLLTRLPDGPQLRIADDGSLVLLRNRQYQEIAPLEALYEQHQLGRVTQQQFDEAGVGFVYPVFEVRDELAAQRRVVQRQRSKGRYAEQRAQAAVDEFNNLEKIVDDIVHGKATAEKLRRYAFESLPGGKATQSAEVRRIKESLTPEGAARLDRLIKNVMASDVKKGRRLLQLQNEEAWDEILFRPLEKTYQLVDETIAGLRAQKQQAVNAEQEAFLENAELFVRQLTFIDEWRRAASPSGTTISPIGKKIGAEGEQTLEDAVDLAADFAKLLETDGPATYRNLMGEVERFEASERGLTAKEISDFAEAARRAKEGAGATMSREGFVAAEAYNLGGRIGDYQMDPVVAQIFRNMIAGQKYLYTPEGVGELRRAVRTYLNWWRPAATIARPAFHARNLISGIANGFLIGVGPRQYSEIMPDYTTFLGNIRAGRTASVDEMLEGVKNKEMFKAALDQNIMSTGFVRSDIAKRATKAGLTLNPADADRFVLFRAGGVTMEKMEDVLRLAAFSKYFDEAVPESAELARSLVMMVHFDYQNLAFLEQKLKPVAPFFVWTRRNVPLQLRAIVERPGYAQVFHHASQAMNDAFGDEDYYNSPLPAHYGFLAAPMGIMLDDDDDTWARFIFDPDLPLGNLENFPLFMRDQSSALPFSKQSVNPIAWFNYAAELLGPQFSVPVEWLSGQGEDYQTNAPAGLNEVGLLLENIDFWLGTDLVQAEGADTRISGTIANAITTAIPFYKDFTGAFETNPTRASRLGLNDESGVADRLRAEVMALVSGGLGQKLQTPADAKQVSFLESEWMAAEQRKTREAEADNPLLPWD